MPCVERVQNLLDDEIALLRDAHVASQHIAELVQEVELLVRVDDLCRETVDFLLEGVSFRTHFALEPFRCSFQPALRGYCARAAQPRAD